MIADTIFYDHAINLTGEDADNCTFDGCIVTLNSCREPGVLRNCTFTYCLLLGDGWPFGLFGL